MARIGIYGAGFDPITYAHLFLANTVLNRKHLDRVIFVPASKKSLRVHPKASGDDRLAMVRLAIADNDGFEVSDFEVKDFLPDTIETMQHFRQQYPSDTVHLILGADALESLPSWPQAKNLLLMNNFIVVDHNGKISSEIIAKSPLLRSYENRFEITHTGLSQDINSDYIRAEVSMGGEPRYLLPEACYDYIRDHGLYGYNG